MEITIETNGKIEMYRLAIEALKLTGETFDDDASLVGRIHTLARLFSDSVFNELDTWIVKPK